MKRKITMQDIADKLGISKNSVSQALSGKSGVSEETRQLIEQTAKELGYVYKSKNIPPKKERNICIGLIATDFAFSLKTFFGEIFLAIEESCMKNGITLNIQSVSQEAKEKLILPDFISEKR